MLTGEQRFESALREAIKASPFFPHISDILKFAGEPIEPQVDREARAALKSMFILMRSGHGVKLRRIQGEILYSGRSGPEDDARYLERPLRSPETPAPVFSPAIEAAIADVGFGDRAEGLASLAEHPALSSKRLGDGETPAGGFHEKNARDIEKRWLESFRRCRAEHLASK